MIVHSDRIPEISSSARTRGPSVVRKKSLGPLPAFAGTKGRGDGGFSLLEVLAAFVVLALVGTALFRIFSGALGNASLSDEYSRATLYAESLLASPGVETPLREGTQQGTSDDGKYAWTAQIAPYRVPGSTPDLDSAADLMPVRLWHIAVTVRWPGVAGSDRTIALATVRIAPRELTP
jgi:general secretion pathway protein I